MKKTECDHSTVSYDIKFFVTFESVIMHPRPPGRHIGIDG